MLWKSSNISLPRMSCSLPSAWHKKNSTLLKKSKLPWYQALATLAMVSFLFVCLLFLFFVCLFVSSCNHGTEGQGWHTITKERATYTCSRETRRTRKAKVPRVVYLPILARARVFRPSFVSRRDLRLLEV